MKPTPPYFIHTAKQVLLGEFTGADIVLDARLCRVLGSQTHPLCQQASEKLRRDFLAANPPKGKLRDA